MSVRIAVMSLLIVGSLISLLGAPASAAVVCGHCQKDNPDDASYCMNCGSPLAAAPAVIRCSGCQRDNPASAQYCMYCGRRFSAAMILFEDTGDGSHLDLGYDVNMAGVSAGSEQLEGSNFARVFEKAGAKAVYIAKTVATGVDGVHLQTRVKFDLSFHGDPTLSKGYPYGTVEIVFTPSKGPSLGTYMYYAYEKHPFENSSLAGTPKSLDRVLSGQRNLAFTRFPAGQWRDFDIDLLQLLRENFPAASPNDVDSVSVLFSIQNYPPGKPLDNCRGQAAIDYVRFIRE
jgi:hypothetical protein